MTVTQIYALLNTVAKELLGETAIVNEDLSNIVDLGDSFANKVGFDNYVKSLSDHVGKMLFVDRKYSGRAPSLLMQSWEFGSILEKVTMEMPEATENESWELQDGTSYDTNIFHKPVVSAKCWNGRTTFETPISITEMQVKSSFSSVSQLNAFISMIYTTIENAMTMKIDSLVMRTINNLIGETIYADYGANALNSKSGTKAVNLLYLYNQRFATTLTAAKALTDLDFIRFAVLTMSNYTARMREMSKLFNIGGKARFTPADQQHIILLDEFRACADIYLQSDTFHNEYTALPKAESVVYWQGSGTDYAFSNTSAINIKTSGEHIISATGILGVMFDRLAAGVVCENSRTTSNYNGKGEFYNYWYKRDAGYFNDTDENCVMFFVA